MVVAGTAFFIIKTLFIVEFIHKGDKLYINYISPPINISYSLRKLTFNFKFNPKPVSILSNVSKELQFQSMSKGHDLFWNR